MIKDLRMILATAMLAVCGTTFAQDATEPANAPVVIEFAKVYGEMDAEDKNGTVVYLNKHDINQDGISVVFDKGNGSSAPNYTIAKGFIKLFGGVVKGDDVDGNTMTYTSDKYITKISLAASNTSQWGHIKADCGTVTLTGESETRPAIDPIWTNIDESGNVVVTKQVVFTVYRDADATKYQQVCYAKATVYTSEDTPTGITSVSADKAQNGVRYNVAGQRVNDSFKGLVIENGKKKIVK